MNDSLEIAHGLWLWATVMARGKSNGRSFRDGARMAVAVGATCHPICRKSAAAVLCAVAPTSAGFTSASLHRRPMAMNEWPAIVLQFYGKIKVAGEKRVFCGEMLIDVTLVSPVKNSFRGFFGSTSFSKNLLVILSSASFGGPRR